MSLLSFFYDPVLRGPTMASILMCFSASLIGVVVFLRRQSLIGESLSHAAYPGVMFGIYFAGLMNLGYADTWQISLYVLGGGALFSLIGLLFIRWMTHRLRIKDDAALCFVLSIFFGVGLLVASSIQFVYPTLYQQAQSFLFGQTATMTSTHVTFFLIQAFIVSILFFLFSKEIQLIAFDAKYAKSLGYNTGLIEAGLVVMTVAAIVIGIRSVGVVLMSAMLIAPAAAARQFTHRFGTMLLLAGAFGALSGFFGNVLSYEGSAYLSKSDPSMRFSLPTGPTIVLVASLICVLSLLLAPKQGIIFELVKAQRFRHTCLLENVLKSIKRYGKGEVSITEIAKYQSISKAHLHLILLRLCLQGFLVKKANGSYALTHEGERWATRIIRLHRLWEVYLADYLKVAAERVHKSAEEMEHIITDELEIELTALLKDPKKDPHHQPIPPRE